MSDESNATQSKPEESPATPAAGLSDQQRADLRKKLADLAAGIGGTVPFAETMGVSPATTMAW